MLNEPEVRCAVWIKLSDKFDLTTDARNFFIEINIIKYWQRWVQLGPAWFFSASNFSVQWVHELIAGSQVATSKSSESGVYLFSQDSD